MRTIEKEVFTFEELTEDAKEKAREWWRNCENENSSFAEYVIDDCKEIASLFGLEIDKIYYSGFYSQGDGACFEGKYGYKKGALKAVQNYSQYHFPKIKRHIMKNLVKQYLKYTQRQKKHKAIIKHYEQLIFSDESEQYNTMIDDLSWQNGVVKMQHDG